MQRRGDREIMRDIEREEDGERKKTNTVRRRKKIRRVVETERGCEKESRERQRKIRRC